MRAPHIRLLAVLLVAVLALASCGGDSDSTDTNAGAGDDTATTTGDDAVEITDEDRARVKTIPLTQDEVGPAYKQTKKPEDADTTTTTAGSTTSTTEDPTSAAFKDCAGGKDLLGEDDENAKAESEFSNEATQGQLTSQATIAASESEVAEVFELLSDDKTLTCFNDAIKMAMTETLGDQGIVAEVTTTRSTLDLPTERETGFAIAFDLSAGGQTFKGFFDMAFFNEGRVVGSLLSFGLGQPFPATERDKLAGIMAARVVDAA